MKKIVIIVLLSSFTIGISLANDGFAYSENFISELKDQSVYMEDGQYEVRKLHRKLNNHFTFISILRQDWTEELMMSLKSDIQPNASASEGQKMNNDDRDNAALKKLNPRFVKYAETE